MRLTKTRLLAIAVTLLLMLALAACGGSKSALVGRWQGEDHVESFCEFFSGGKIHFTTAGGEWLGTWEEENGKLIIMATSDGREFNEVWEYELSGSTLTVTRPNSTVIYNKD